ncbi:MAG: hypothetical protein R3199_01815 [Gemmatimonadota bacterium]|nr:hypothetical protein [Gemmatimonadota bacterium]
MTLEDLQSAGVVLPEEEWGERELTTTVSKPGTIATAAVAVATGLMMYLGGGEALTWIGGGLFLVDLLAFTWLVIRAVDLQAERYPHRAPEPEPEEAEPRGERGGG